jgi:hypothetical protein
MQKGIQITALEIIKKRKAMENTVTASIIDQLWGEIVKVNNSEFFKYWFENTKHEYKFDENILGGDLEHMAKIKYASNNDIEKDAVDVESKEFKKFCADFLEEKSKYRYDSKFLHFKDEFFSVAKYGKYGLKIYRALAVPDPDEFIFHSAFDTYINDHNGIGVYWAWDEERAFAHWAREGKGGEIVVVHAEAPLSSIDIKATLLFNMNPSFGRDEAEIRLKNKAKVVVIGFDVTPYRGSPYNEFIPVDVEKMQVTADKKLLSKAASEELTKVVFKKFPEGDVIAIFPDEVADPHGNLMSYMHVGQHGACSPEQLHLLDDATPEEYAPLKKELESLSPEPYHLQIVQGDGQAVMMEVVATGEPDQEYDHEIYDHICEALKKYGYECSHREFDKYQGVKIDVKKDGKIIDTLWTKDFYFQGPTKQNPAHKYRKATLIGPDGEYSADRGDYWNLGPDHVFEDNILVLERLQGEDIEIENPKVSDLPDGSEIKRSVEFEGTPDDVLVLYGEAMGEDEDIHVLVTPEGEVDVEELAEYLMHVAEMELGGAEAATAEAEETEAAKTDEILVFDKDGQYMVGIRNKGEWDMFQMSPDGKNKYQGTGFQLKPPAGSERIDWKTLPEQMQKIIKDKKSKAVSALEKANMSTLKKILASDKAKAVNSALAKVLAADYHSKTALKNPWVIKDWAGNLMDFGRFKTFDDAEEFLSEKLGDGYETDRGEYEIQKDTKE